MPELEFKKLQEQKFLSHINQIYEKSALWREALKKSNIMSKNDLPNSLDEISKLPILGREFLLEWTKSKEKLIDSEYSIQTSGTTQKPVKVDYSKKSVEIGWGKLGLRALLLMGIDPKEKGIMLTSFNEKTKTSHSSHVNTLALKNILDGNLIDQIISKPLNESIEKFAQEKVKWIGTVPIFYSASVARAKEKNIDLKSLGIKSLFYGGVGFPKDKLRKVQETYNAEVRGFYPSTELCSAGTQTGKNNEFLKLENEDQYILFNDYIIFELLDENNQPVKEGEVGRIIATPIFIDGTPLIRYDIGDEAVFHGHKNNLIIVSNIKRSNAIYFSNGKYHFYEVEDMRQEISKNTNIDISAIQVAKVLGGKEVELPIIRIETKNPITDEEKKFLEKESKIFFASNENIQIMLDRGIHGGIYEPVVEFYNYKKLVPEGAFKSKLVSDETDIWSSYAFHQSKVQEHMSLIRELADNVVYGLKECNSVVDMASGSGYFSSRLARMGIKVDAVDLNSAMLHYAKKRIDDMQLNNLVSFHQKPAENTGFDSGSKDGINITNILCHIDNSDDVLNEAKRILNHNGKLTVGEPNKEFNLEAVEKLRKISQRDVDNNPEIAPFYDSFVRHNQKMAENIKTLLNVSEMKVKLENLGFDIIETKPMYAGISYYILANLLKRCEFRKNILEMNRFSAPIDNRTNQENLLLDFNEKTTSPSPKVKEALKDFIEKGGLNLYSSVNRLTKKIAKYSNVGENEVMVTNGSYQAIDIIFRSLLKEGDKVIIPKPAFDVFDQCANMQGAEIKEVHYKSDGTFPLDEILSNIDETVKLVVICNPNNPTGTSVLKIDIEKILKKSKTTTALVDEAYFEFCGLSCCDLIDKYPNLIITRTFSKAFGLASLRAGYMISNETNIKELSKLRSPFDVNMLAQVAASVALDDLEYMNQYTTEVMHKSKPMLEYFFIKNQIPFYPSASNFLFVKIKDPINMYEKLKEKGIFVSPKCGKEIGEGIRVSVGNVEQTKQFILACQEILNK